MKTEEEKKLVNRMRFVENQESGLKQEFFIVAVTQNRFEILYAFYFDLIRARGNNKYIFCAFHLFKGKFKS